MLLRDRVKALIRVPKRGRLHWFSKKKLVKIEIDREEQRVKRWGKANWTASFRKLPKADYDEYDKHKRGSLGTKGEDEKIEKYYSPRQAAQVWLVPIKTANHWINIGKVKSVKTANGRHRIPQSEVDRLKPIEYDAENQEIQEISGTISPARKETGGGLP